MSLRDALTAIALGHRPTTHRVRSKLRPDVHHNEPACRDCDWTGVGPLMETHAAHIADLQIAYLRDNLARHAEELGMTPMCAPVVVDDDGHTWPAWNKWYDDRRHAVKATADSPWSVLGVAYSTDWSRADD